MPIDLDEVIGLCRDCGESLGDMPPPYCTKCASHERKRISSVKEKDPYKKVWDSAEDEEAELLSWVKNGTLFVPTWEEMSRRHASTAKYLLARARKLGRTAEGISVFNEALFHRNMAKHAIDKHQEVLVLSR